MKKLLMLGFAAVFAAVLCCALPAKADEVYTYSGNDLSGCTGCFVSVTFTLPTALPASQTDDNVTADVTSFTFSDNIGDTVSNTDPNFINDDFEFWTNGSGAITQWNMFGCDYAFAVVAYCIGTENEPGTFVGDSAGLFAFEVIPVAVASNSDDPGNAPAIDGSTAAPENSTWLFLAFGLAALGLMQWRRTNATRFIPASSL